MNKQLIKYFVEVSIIFVGITLGLLVNEWREHRYNVADKQEVYQSLKIELNRAKGFIQEANESTTKVIKEITSFLIHKPVSDDLLLELFSTSVSQFSNDLTGIMNNSLSLITSNTRLLSPNDTLKQYAAYIQHIVDDHSKINLGIHEIADHQLWPILEKYSITLDLNDLQHNSHDIANLKGNYLSVISDKEIRSILRQIRYKKNEQRIIYEILTAHLDKMIHQLERESR